MRASLVCWVGSYVLSLSVQFFTAHYLGGLPTVKVKTEEQETSLIF